jgi:hypothetical protein
MRKLLLEAIKSLHEPCNANQNSNGHHILWAWCTFLDLLGDRSFEPDGVVDQIIGLSGPLEPLF